MCPCVIVPRFCMALFQTGVKKQDGADVLASVRRKFGKLLLFDYETFGQSVIKISKRCKYPIHK